MQNMNIMKHIWKDLCCEKGMSLIEIMIIIMIVGVITLISYDFSRISINNARIQGTLSKMVMIEKAIEDYILSRGEFPVLPCPAQTGELKSINITNNGLCNITNGQNGCTRTGSVVTCNIPFDTIGLDPVYGTDSWGNTMRYSIDENFISAFPDNGSISIWDNDSNIIMKDAILAITSSGIDETFETSLIDHIAIQNDDQDIITYFNRTRLSFPKATYINFASQEDEERANIAVTNRLVIGGG